MKKLIVLLSTALLVTAVGFAAESVEGYWAEKNESSGKTDGGWQIYIEKNMLSGKIVSASKAAIKAAKCKPAYPGFPVPGKVNEMNIGGTPWLFGLKKEKEGVWGGGTFIDPDDGKVYKAKVIFRAPGGGKFTKNTLELSLEIGAAKTVRFLETATKADAEKH